MKLLIKTTEHSEHFPNTFSQNMDDCDLPNNCEQNDQGDSGDSGQFSESPNENNYKVHQPRVLGLVLPFFHCVGGKRRLCRWRPK